ncbi:hypothetical protein W201_02113 [Staphylococcus aureus DAR5877]|nr:hypothetical protein W201_02113 [Staphylococcus aureus DAR5877]
MAFLLLHNYTDFIELLKKYGLEKITLSNILYEFKSNGLHQQKNFDGNK